MFLNNQYGVIALKEMLRKTPGGTGVYTQEQGLERRCKLTIRFLVAPPIQPPCTSDGKTIAQVMNRIGHNGGAVGQPATYKFNNRKRKIQKKCPAHAF